MNGGGKGHQVLVLRGLEIRKQVVFAIEAISRHFLRSCYSSCLLFEIWSIQCS